ncbi:MAG TPA: ferritin-like domain-containing protein [Gaiellaceae bacterium]|nr:ferritin-like domain-containing protein [Gaiellaceae bacterium]
MTEPLTLEAVDRDGALQEALEEIAGSTRTAFLKKAAFGGGTLALGGLFAGGFPALAKAQSPAQDAQILNFALLLEYLEADYYTQAVSKGGLSGEALRFAKVVGAHERAHVAFLKNALGAAARAKPEFNFMGATETQVKFLATAIVFEDTGVGAYNGAGPMLTKPVLAAAATIVGVEGEHAGWVRHIALKNPAPQAFDPLLSVATVTKRVSPFIAS